MIAPRGLLTRAVQLSSDRNSCLVFFLVPRGWVTSRTAPLRPAQPLPSGRGFAFQPWTR